MRPQSANARRSVVNNARPSGSRAPGRATLLRGGRPPTARPPRTSLIDAEWEWLAHRAPAGANDGFERPAQGDAVFEQARPHTKTLPPPSFHPSSSTAQPAAREAEAELSRTLKSAAPECQRVASVVRRRPRVGKAVAIIATALVSFALGVGLLQLSMSALDGSSHASSAGYSARLPVVAPSAATSSLELVEHAVKPAPLGVMFQPRSVGVRRASDATAGTARSRPNKAMSRTPLASKKRPAVRRPSSDNPY